MGSEMCIRDRRRSVELCAGIADERHSELNTNFSSAEHLADAHDNESSPEVVTVVPSKSKKHNDRARRICIHLPLSTVGKNSFPLTCTY